MKKYLLQMQSGNVVTLNEEDGAAVEMELKSLDKSGWIQVPGEHGVTRIARDRIEIAGWESCD